MSEVDLNYVVRSTHELVRYQIPRNIVEDVLADYMAEHQGAALNSGTVATPHEDGSWTFSTTFDAKQDPTP